MKSFQSRFMKSCVCKSCCSYSAISRCFAEVSPHPTRSAFVLLIMSIHKIFYLLFRHKTSLHNGRARYDDLFDALRQTGEQICDPAMRMQQTQDNHINLRINGSFCRSGFAVSLIGPGTSRNGSHTVMAMRTEAPKSKGKLSNSTAIPVNTI